jgi:hypothetical protein
MITPVVEGLALVSLSLVYGNPAGNSRRPSPSTGGVIVSKYSSISPARLRPPSIGGLSSGFEV